MPPLSDFLALPCRASCRLSAPVEIRPPSVCRPNMVWPPQLRGIGVIARREGQKLGRERILLVRTRARVRPIFPPVAMPLPACRTQGHSAQWPAGAFRLRPCHLPGIMPGILFFRLRLSLPATGISENRPPLAPLPGRLGIVAGRLRRSTVCAPRMRQQAVFPGTRFAPSCP